MPVMILDPILSDPDVRMPGTCVEEPLLDQPPASAEGIQLNPTVGAEHARDFEAASAISSRVFNIRRPTV